jgi:transcriptional regulator with XRE-family HTH domain
MTNTTTDLAKRVVSRMEQLGLSQAEVARRGRFNRAFVSDLVRGKKQTLHSANLIKLARALETTPKYLHGTEEATVQLSPYPVAAHAGPDDDILLSMSPARPKQANRQSFEIPTHRSTGRLDGAAVITEPSAYELPSLAELSRDEIYAIAVSDDTMSPRYQAGDYVYALPRAKVRPKDFVVVKVRAKNDSSGMTIAYVRQLLLVTPEEVIVRQLSPGLETRFPRSRYVEVEKIVLSGDPTDAAF